MTVPPWAAAYVVTTAAAWSADHFNSRGLHSAAFALIGAMGFLASAVLPPDAYLVSPFPSPPQLPQYTKDMIAPLRLPHRGNQRRLRLHPAAARLAVGEPDVDGGHGAGDRAERVVRGAGADCRGVDLQERGEGARVSDGALDECGVVAVCLCRVCGAAVVLWVEESGGDWEEVCLLTLSGA